MVAKALGMSRKAALLPDHQRRSVLLNNKSTLLGSKAKALLRVILASAVLSISARAFPLPISAFTFFESIAKTLSKYLVASEGSLKSKRALPLPINPSILLGSIDIAMPKVRLASEA